MATEGELWTKQWGGSGGKGRVGTLGAYHSPYMYLGSIPPDQQSQTWFKYDHSFKTRDLDITTITTPKSQ